MLVTQEKYGVAAVLDGDAEGAREALEFGGGGGIGDGATGRGDVFGSSLLASFGPLMAHLSGGEFLEVDFIDAAEDGLGKLRADIGDGDAAGFHGMLDDGRREIGELADVGALEKMQVQDGEFGVG